MVFGIYIKLYIFIWWLLGVINNLGFLGYFRLFKIKCLKIKCIQEELLRIYIYIFYFFKVGEMGGEFIQVKIKVYCFRGVGIGYGERLLEL